MLWESILIGLALLPSPQRNVQPWDCGMKLRPVLDDDTRKIIALVAIRSPHLRRFEKIHDGSSQHFHWSSRV